LSSLLELSEDARLTLQHASWLKDIYFNNASRQHSAGTCSLFE